jgi:hypothetical protein
MESLKIMLTNHPPALIREDEWPGIARGNHTIDTREPMRGGGRASIINFYVRQHSDGRVIVNSTYHTMTKWQEERLNPMPIYYGGKLLQEDEDILSAIRETESHMIQSGGVDEYIHLAVGKCLENFPPIEL